MQYPNLQRILRQEGTHFQDVTDIWKPTQLLFVAQVRKLLDDMQGKFNEVSSSSEELQNLPRSDRYFKQLTDMRLALREANFSWKANQVRFINAASRFYSSFAEMLRFLRWEAQAGTFSQPVVKHLKGV